MNVLNQIENENLTGTIETKKKSMHVECVNTTNEKKWKRNCPMCNKEIFYGYKHDYIKGYKENTKCSRCRQIGKSHYIPFRRKKYTNETPIYKRNCPKCGEELFNKSKWYIDGCIKSDRLCRKCSPLKKKRLIVPVGGWKRNCPDCGCEIIHTEKYSRDRFKRLNTLCKRCNQRGERSVCFGKHLSADVRRKIRLSTIERLKNLFVGFHPGFNYTGCEYFKWLNMWNGWDGQYATKSGEYFIKYLGYWVDYYEPKENIVIEWDEPTHYDINGNLKQKDIKRMDEIKKYLNCRFFRYNQKINELKEY